MIWKLPASRAVCCVVFPGNCQAVGCEKTPWQAIAVWLPQFAISRCASVMRVVPGRLAIESAGCILIRDYYRLLSHTC